MPPDNYFHGLSIRSQSLLDDMPQGVSIFDEHLRLQRWNKRFIEIFHFPPECIFAGVRFDDLIRINAMRGEYGPGQIEKVVRVRTAQARRFRPHCITRRTTDGRSLLIQGHPLYDEGRIAGFISTYTDITGKAEEEPRRKHTEERLRLTEKVFEHSPGAIVICDHLGHIASVNPAFTEITGYTLDDVLGRHPKMLLSDEHSESTYAAMWKSLKVTGRWSGDIWGLRKNGEAYPKWLTVNVVPDETTGVHSHYIGMFSDMTKRKEAEERIYRLAHQDSLTGLPNRFTLEARLEHFLHDARRHEMRVAVMFVDLDHFKTINDSLGHAVGDRLLIEVASRLTGIVRESDTVARLGGDEFVIVMPDFESTTDISLAANRIIESFTEALRIGEHEFHSSVSIGISVFPDDGDSADAIMRSADTAMYHAKALGRNNFQYFAPALNRAAMERLAVESKLRHALARREFELHYQPQYDTATRRIVGMEALLRWRPDGGELVPPERFIPIAEETGMIAGIGTWVLQQSCRQLRAWLDSGLAPIRLAVNVSARQLRHKSFSDIVSAVLDETGIPPALLELEITESTAMDHPQDAVRLLQDLKDMGVTLAIDDFGTGYSSLSYLKLLPIDRLKIDRSFVTDIDKDANDAAIARATIALAHSLGLQVTAEGAETGSQVDLLDAEGCDEVQGYYLCTPLPADEVALLLPASTSSVVSLADWLNRPR